MQAVVLAAGEGTRLKPITLARSKAMVPIVGKPMVERVMDDLVATGFDDLILVISPQDREIVQHFRTARIGARVRFVHQVERLGMAHALLCAAPLIQGDFLLSACDNLVSAEHVGRMVSAWRAEPRPSAVLSLMPVEPERRSSVGIVAMDGPWVTRIVEKPRPGEAPSDMSSLSLYLFGQRLLDYLPQVQLSPRGEYELQDAIQMLIEGDGRVAGVITRQRLTLTSPADLLALTRHYLAGGSYDAPVADSRIVPPVHVGEGAIIGQGCLLGPNVAIEGGCHIGAGAVLRNSVVLRGSVLPEGAVIENQVVAAGQ